LFFLALVTLQVSRADEKVHGAARHQLPGKHWTQAGKPEDQGWSSDKLAVAKAYADSIDTAAVVLNGVRRRLAANRST
jgi:hypothetical protein